METIEQAVWTDHAIALDRAKNSGSPERILQACDDAEKAFRTHGWPDWWSRIERLRNDAFEAIKRRDRWTW